MRNAKKSLNKIAIINLVSTIVLQGIAFFSAPIFSRLLGTSNYGIISVYRTWVSLAATILSLQLASTIANARASFNSEDQEKYQSSVMSLSILVYGMLSIIVLIVCLILSNYIAINILMVVCVLLQGLGTYLVNTLNSKLTYEFKANKNALIAIVLSVGNIAFSLIFVLLLDKDNNYWGKIFGELIINVLVGLIGYVLIFYKGKTFYNKEYWKFTIPIALPTIFHLLANIILSQSDKLMLQKLLGNSSVGVYALAFTFASIMSTIYGALNNTWVPFYFEYTKYRQLDEVKKHAKNYVELYTIISCGFMLLSREVFHIIADKSYWNGTSYVVVFAVGLYMVFLYSFPVNYEFYYKKTKLIAIGTTLAAVCNISLNYIFIRVCGAIGAVLATTISYILQFTFHYICAQRIIKEEFPYSMKIFLPGIGIVYTVAIFSLLSQSYVIIRWLLAGGIGIYLLKKIYSRKSLF